MSATSSSFWSATESIKDDLNEIASLGIDLYATLEANDDPAEIADLMTAIHAKMGSVSSRIAQTIPAMQDVAKAFDAVAAIKS
jgi:hypothetical protein